MSHFPSSSPFWEDIATETWEDLMELDLAQKDLIEGNQAAPVMDPSPSPTLLNQEESSDKKIGEMEALIDSIAREEDLREEDPEAENNSYVDNVKDDPDFDPKHREPKERRSSGTTGGRKRARSRSQTQKSTTPSASHLSSSPPKRVRIMQTRISDQILAKSKSRARKVYELEESFDNPAMEKARLNAINAKINRDRKKKEREALILQMDQLRERNEELLQENQAMESRALSAERQLQRLQNLLLSHNLGPLLQDDRHHDEDGNDACEDLGAI